MTERATAAVLTGAREIRIEDFPLPEVGPEDGLLAVEACGVCAADVPVYQGRSTFELPVILGHEIVGRIARVGENAARRWGVAEGDRVVIERWIPCGHCERCYTGNYRMCVPEVAGRPLFYGGSPTALEPSLYGGYADHVYLHPNAVVYPVADHPPAVEFPLFTPLGNTISWLQQAGGARVGSSVVIQGPGQEGLAAVLAARSLGAAQIIVVGLPSDAKRLAHARKLGATATFMVDEDDVSAGVHEATDGEGADVVLDVTSTPSTQPMTQALELVGRNGTIVVSAHHSDRMVDLSSELLSQKAATIRGVHGRDRASLRAALRLIEAQELPLSTLTTHEFGVADTLQALQIVARESGEEDAFHVSIVPGHDA